MEEQRSRARMGTATAHGSEDHHGAVLSFARRLRPRASSATRSCAPTTSLLAVQGDDGRALVKLEESPFYAEGGGQVADSGGSLGGRQRDGSPTSTGSERTRPSSWSARMAWRPGRGSRRRSTTSPASRRCATTRRPICCTRRSASGSAPMSGRPARRSAPTSCASTSRTALRWRRRSCSDIGDRVNERIKESRPVRRWRCRAWTRSGSARWRCSARSTATGSAWSRSRTSRASSAGGPMSPTRRRSGSSRSPPRARAPPRAPHRGSHRPRGDRLVPVSLQAAQRDRAVLGAEQDPLGGARRAAERLQELEQQTKQAGSAVSPEGGGDGATGQRIGGITVFVGRGEDGDQRSLLDLADRIKSRAGEAAVVLGGAADGRWPWWRASAARSSSAGCRPPR